MPDLTTSQVIQKYGISLSWLYWAKRLVNVKPRQEIVGGRARNLFTEAEVKKIMKLKRGRSGGRQDGSSIQ